MLYVRTDKDPDLVLKHGVRTFQQTVGGSSIERIGSPKIVKFNRIKGNPFYVAKLRTKEQLAYAVLDTKEEAVRLGVPESEIIKLVESHKSYGTSIVRLGNALDSVTSNYIIERDGNYFCEICEDTMATVQASLSHERSEKHRRKVIKMQQLFKGEAKQPSLEAASLEATEIKKDVLDKIDKDQVVLPDASDKALEEIFESD